MRDDLARWRAGDGASAINDRPRAPLRREALAQDGRATERVLIETGLHRPAFMSSRAEAGAGMTPLRELCRPQGPPAPLYDPDEKYQFFQYSEVTTQPATYTEYAQDDPLHHRPPIMQFSHLGFDWRYTLWPELSGSPFDAGSNVITGSGTTTTLFGNIDYSARFSLLDIHNTELKWATATISRSDYQQTVDHPAAGSTPETLDGSANGTFHPSANWGYDSNGPIEKFVTIQIAWSVYHTESGPGAALDVGSVFAVFNWVASKRRLGT